MNKKTILFLRDAADINLGDGQYYGQAMVLSSNAGPHKTSLHILGYLPSMVVYVSPFAVIFDGPDHRKGSVESVGRKAGRGEQSLLGRTLSNEYTFKISPPVSSESLPVFLGSDSSMQPFVCRVLLKASFSSLTEFLDVRATIEDHRVNLKLWEKTEFAALWRSHEEKGVPDGLMEYIKYIEMATSTTDFTGLWFAVAVQFARRRIPAALELCERREDNCYEGMLHLSDMPDNPLEGCLIAREMEWSEREFTEFCKYTTLSTHKETAEVGRIVRFLGQSTK